MLLCGRRREEGRRVGWVGRMSSIQKRCNQVDTHTVRPGYTAVVVGCGGVGGSGRRENKEKDRGNGVT